MAKKEKKPQPTTSTLEALKDLVNRQYGEGSIIQGRDGIVPVDVFPTGIASVDIALGVGGIPMGRTIEIFGAESSGKTTFCLQAIAACQKHRFEKKERNGVVAFIDAEHALDSVWAGKIGVDMDEILLSQPNSGEEALNICEMMSKSKQVDLIVVDSVAALVPKAELEGEIGDHHVGAQARMMSQAMRKLGSEASKSQTTIIFINQIREKIGVMFGSPEVSPGGRALKFYASIRAQLSKGSALKDGDVVVGFRPTMKFIKNKVAPPFTKAEFDICAGTPERPVYGIDAAASLIDVAGVYKIVIRSGSHYKYGDQILGNGLGRASKFLRENPDMFEEIKQKTYREAFGSTDPKPVPDFDVDDDLIDAE